MVTGDNLDTAVAISKEAGILPAHYVHGPDSLAVLEGKVFRNLVKGLVQNKIKNDKGEIEEVH
jgi:Ca2+ transporting ATPase